MFQTEEESRRRAAAFAEADRRDRVRACFNVVVSPCEEIWAQVNRIVSTEGPSIESQVLAMRASIRAIEYALDRAEVQAAAIQPEGK